MSENNVVKVVTLQNAKDIGRIISNSTSQSIIEFIRKNKGSTASEISKKLNIPASTVHYNISALAKAQIIDSNSFHYSSKGKEVLHYKVSDQVIVIVPDSKSPSITNKLRMALPGVFGFAAIAGLWFTSKLFSTSNKLSNSIPLMKIQDAALTKNIPNQVFSESVNPASNNISNSPNLTLILFLGLALGILISIISVIIYLKIKEKKTINK